MCVCAGTGPSHDSKRGPQWSGRPRGEGGRGCHRYDNSPLTPTSAVKTSKEGGRTSNPNRQRSSGSFLKGYTQRRRHQAREGRVGRPRPSGDAPNAPSPPPAHPRSQPRERPGGIARLPLPWNSAAAAGQVPSGDKGVCVRPAGARISPPFSRRPRPPAPLRPAADPLGRFLPPDKVDAGGEGRRGVSGTARASGFLRGSASGSELTVPGEPNS